MASESVAVKLAELVANADIEALSPVEMEAFGAYFNLFNRWNERTNLSAIRDEDGILRRHFLESIACARLLPLGLQSLLDFGSGGGLPGIPIAICRSEIAVVLAESQGKKAAFLQEAVRVLKVNARVHAGRAEALKTTFDCVTLRAVDRMEAAVQAASALVCAGGWMAMMTTREDQEKLAGCAGSGFDWQVGGSLAGSERGILLLGKRR